MTKLYLSLAAMLAVMPASAQIEKLNPAGQLELKQYNLERKINSQSTTTTARIEQCLMELEEGADFAALESLGVELKSSIGSILIVTIPLDVMEQVLALPEVKQVSFGDIYTPTMNYGRPGGNVDAVQSGFDYNGSTCSFDGRGVVTGLMDTGLDPNHINFKDADGNLRVKRMFWLNGSAGSVLKYETPSAIEGFTSDNTSKTHGTHVAGIMSGSYNGAGTYAYMNKPTTGATLSITNGQIPYYGVATGSDIAMSGGSLTNSNILSGVQEIVEYAKSQGQPCVVNLSLGSTIGPHDGSSMFERALTTLAENSIICVSSGNDGDTPLSLQYAFSATKTQLKTCLTYADQSDTDDNRVNGGILDIWSSDSKPLTVSVGIVNKSTGKFTALGTVDGTTRSAYISGGEFGKYFSGSVSMTAGVDSNNNRFQVYISTTFSHLTSNNAQNYVAVTVTGESGTTAYLYGSSLCLRSKSFAGFTTGNAKNSINNIATADNVIAVGAYTTRNVWGRLDGNTLRYSSNDFIVGSIAPFSSYGKKFGGSQLPDVAAPGALIMSSYSTPYVNANVSDKNTMSAKATVNGKTYYWAGEQGTSMSCPFVSGTVALWLQADPTLKYSDVINVIKNTSVAPGFGEDTDRWGAGKIDALEGIKYVLANRAAIGSVFADNDERLVVNVAEGSVTAFVAGASQLTARLYSLGGSTVATAAGADSAEISTASIGSGVYILSVESDEGRFTRKIIVK